MRALVLMLGCALVAGCGGEDEPAPARRGPARGAEHSSAATLPQPEPPPTPLRARGPSALEAVPSPEPSLAHEPEPPTEEAPAEEEEERDLGGELRAAIGTPSQCVSYESTRDLGAQLRVSVTAWVTAMGRVTRAEVTGPESVRACVQRIAEGVTLTPPIDDAPRSVRAELVFDLERQVPAVVPSQSPEVPLPPGAQAPGITLPALGGSDHPSGYIAPSRTLPAAAGDDRPPGFVPPSSTLPARVD